MHEDFSTDFKKARDAAERVYEQHECGRVYHCAKAALRSLSPNEQMPDDDFHEALTMGSHAFSDRSTHGEDFAQLLQLKIWELGEIYWWFPIPKIPIPFHCQSPDDITIESMKPETQKKIVIGAAVTIAAVILTRYLLHQFRCSRKTDVMPDYPKQNLPFIIICRMNEKLPSSPGTILDKSTLGTVLDSARFYAYGKDADFAGTDTSLDESAADTSTYCLIKLTLPAGTNIQNLENSALRGTTLREAINTSSVEIEEIKYLKSLPQVETLKSYL